MRMTTWQILFGTLAIATLSACPPLQSEECAKHLDCVAHYNTVFDLAQDPTLDDTFGEAGTCWKGAQTAETCTRTCDIANALLKDALVTAGEELGPCE